RRCARAACRSRPAARAATACLGRSSCWTPRASAPPCPPPSPSGWARWRCTGSWTPPPASCSAAAPDLGMVLAETQSAGRGRRGRTWLSPPGLNLYLSCLKRFDTGFAALSGLSLALGVIVLRTLESLGIAGAGLKWPNDVLAAAPGHAPGKLAGI